MKMKELIHILNELMAGRQESKIHIQIGNTKVEPDMVSLEDDNSILIYRAEQINT